MPPEVSTHAARVLLDADSLAAAAACVAQLATHGIAAECGAGTPGAFDLRVAALDACGAGSSEPWIAVLQSGDEGAFARALELGALACLARDADVEEVTRQVRFALRDLEHRRIQQRITDLLEHVERAAGVGSFEYEPAGGRLWLSAEARRLVGLEHDAGTPVIERLVARIAPADRRRLAEWLARLGSGQAPRELDCRLLDPVGRAAQVRFSAPDAGAAPRQRVVRGVVEDASDAAPGKARGAGSAVVGFEPDARQFLCALAGSIERAESRGEAVTLLVIDSDELRSLAASVTRAHYGHLLDGLALRVRAAVRDARGIDGADDAEHAHSLGRTQGGGLIVSVPTVGRRDDALVLGARISAWIGKPAQVGNREVSLTCGIGVITSSLECRDSEELVRRAETAAYCARREGRDRVKLYTPSMDAEAFERLSLEAALRRALARDELVLHYQPRVEIRTGRIVGFEALVRWQHPDLGFVAPARFIPVAEETGLIVPVGAHVMHVACRQAKAWLDAGLPPVRMSVNLSPLQLHDPGLLDTIEECLRAADLPADTLELELTESALMRDPAADVELLRRIKALGVHLSIDDFGTGYSSLAYLRRFPVDALKIDRSFLRDATSRPDDASIFSAIVLMGRSLKMTVVAEGVETPSQLALLRVMRADEAQGFLLSPPVPFDQAARLLAKGTIGLAAP